MYRIAELARRQKEIIDYLTDGRKDEWIQHLMKIQIFNSDGGLIDHWKHEVFSLFHSIPKLRNSNKYPSEDFIFNQLWDNYGDRLDAFIDLAQAEEPSERLKCHFSFSEIILNTKNYILWLASTLSRKGFVSSTEVYNKIWELMGI